MRRSLISAGALVAAMAGSLVLAPAASASDSTTHPTLRQKLPRTATTNDGGAPQKAFGQCEDIPADQDGWHFVLPGNKGQFVELKVTFVPGGTKTITDFTYSSNAEGKHAFVGSEAGATLEKVEATITGSVPHNKFNLSHTCPASAKPTPTGTPTTSAPTPTDTPTTGTPTGTPTTDAPTTGTPTTGTPSGTPSESTAPSGTPTTGGPTTGTPGESVSPTSTSSESAGQPVPSASGSSAPGGSAEGDLAETGSSAPVGVLAAVAVALAGAGAFLVSRRRKAQQH
ncbi:LPXTG cell wall anchor domain-containing protein [Streptomyces sp. NPDC126503]|uniref:LPXTG cell wall anchor domain-containing protein n=1 Tax=Streptomyces sp. NPDC126503 TaxID=3155315 RepID=UPI003324C576